MRVSFDYTDYEKSLWGNPDNGLICNNPACDYEGDEAPDSDEADRKSRRIYAWGYMSFLTFPLMLIGGAFILISYVVLEWWKFALVLIGIIVFMTSLVCWGVFMGNDHRKRLHKVRLCPVCRKDSMIPLDSRRGQFMRAMKQEPPEVRAARLAERWRPSSPPNFSLNRRR